MLNIIYTEFEVSVKQLAGCQVSLGTRKANEHLKLINIQVRH